MKAKVSYIAGFILICFSAMLKAEPAAESLLNALQKIETFKANFVQKIHDANGEHVAKTQGEIMVRRPGKFYWKSQSPDPILVVADGKFLWTYDIDLSQVTKQKLQEALGNSPAALLAGSLSSIKSNFEISQGNKNQCPKSNECYLLKPKQKDAAFADILIGFAKGKLTEVRMHDPLGQDVYTLFTEVLINQGVQDKVFAFIPPKGVDIIHSGS
ncbi:MAG: outer membrane lipoprotein chaperone LolA [Proteobacteria bacterium]|nr:outer membrane lipoprotein chaperone LolA [Pseudomonadota bacterium]